MSPLDAFICNWKSLIRILIIAFILPLHSEAQVYFFDNYSIKQGLGEQKVYALLQDKNDYIWLGTANGLSRFDGKRFRNFSSMDGLAPGGVRSIGQDSLGNIWFGHLDGGVSRFDGHLFESAVFDSIALHGDLSGIAQAGSKIWFTSAADGALMAEFPVKDIKKIRARQFRGKDGLSDQVFGLTVTRNRSIICVADVGMRKFNFENQMFENYRMPHMTTYFNSTCLLEDSKGNLWFGTHNGGIYHYIMSESRMEMIDLPKEGIPSNWISCLTEDKRGRLWIGTFGGGIAYIEDNKVFRFNNLNGFKPLYIYSILEDVEGNILIADRDNGVTIFKGNAFFNINEETPDEKIILPDPNVNAVFQDAVGAMWFGTNAGISRYTPWSGKPGVIYDKNKNETLEDIRFIKEDRNGNLWIGTNAGGVIQYNIKNGKFENQPYINSKLYRGGQVRALEIDRNNKLWIGTMEGVAVGSINKQNFTRSIKLGTTTVSLIESLYCDPHGKMWIGIPPSGEKAVLIRFNPSDSTFTEVGGLKGLIPKTMVMDLNDILWVGTNEGLKGLRNDSLVYSVTQNEGLLSNIVNLVTTGKDGSIYVGTNSGLNRFFPQTNSVFSYTERNGFPGIETKPNAVFNSPDGNIWFGTANGATCLNPSRISSEENEPLTHIMGIQVQYEPRELNEGLKLNHKENSILFDYYSICLTNPDVVRYRVKLDGAEKDWQPLTDQTRAIYSALPAGKYTFNVIASNSMGIWNKEPVKFSFIIKPPFYFTWWFILGSLILIVIVIITYIKIREQALVKEKIILEEKVKERTAEVVLKSMEIEEKNRDITASIRYAERIQRAMLPREDTFKETFVLFMPKDIVSGDFYWMYDNGDWQFIAAVDCTGHGVPGAFMSIIGHNTLNKVVREYGITRPSAIVDQLNNEVMKALLQRQEKAINDGMDLALIAFNRKTFTLEFAGAYNPIFVVRKGEIFVYKGDRFPIGMSTMDSKKQFTNQTVDIQPGDMIYMTSDGYADQFGTPEAKKFKTSSIKILLSEIWHLPVNEQKLRLEKEILAWKGDLDQVDDIMFIGTRIPER